MRTSRTSAPGSGAGTFYDTLGVPNDASQEDLRKAWLALARKYHPDKTGGHKGSEDKLKSVNEAYDTLKRPEKRQQYDEMIAAPFQGRSATGADATQGRSPFNGSGSSERFEHDANYEDLFADLFGRNAQARQRGPVRGRDLETEASISLRESATGTRKSFRLPSMVSCEACDGSGAAPGTSAQPCPQCQGAGHISVGHGSLFEMSQVCPRCRGRGTFIATPCPGCGGSGTTTEIRTVSISIPAGVRTGVRLRLAGQGEPGDAGAPHGDLIVVIRVEEEALFKRTRNDLLCDVPITFTQAALGGNVDVPTLSGKARLKIPAGTQPGTVLRMRGLGFPPFHAGHGGDQLVRVLVEVPRTLTGKQAEAVEALHETVSPDGYPNHHAFASRLERWRAG